MACSSHAFAARKRDEDALLIAEFRCRNIIVVQFVRELSAAVVGRCVSDWHELCVRRGRVWCRVRRIRSRAVDARHGDDSRDEARCSRVRSTNVAPLANVQCTVETYAENIQNAVIAMRLEDGTGKLVELKHTGGCAFTVRATDERRWWRRRIPAMWQ